MRKVLTSRHRGAPPSFGASGPARARLEPLRAGPPAGGAGGGMASEGHVGSVQVTLRRPPRRSSILKGSEGGLARFLRVMPLPSEFKSAPGQCTHPSIYPSPSPTAQLSFSPSFNFRILAGGWPDFSTPPLSQRRIWMFPRRPSRAAEFKLLPSRTFRVEPEHASDTVTVAVRRAVLSGRLGLGECVAVVACVGLGRLVNTFESCVCIPKFAMRQLLAIDEVGNAIMIITGRGRRAGPAGQLRPGPGPGPGPLARGGSAPMAGVCGGSGPCLWSRAPRGRPRGGRRRRAENLAGLGQSRTGRCCAI